MSEAQSDLTIRAQFGEGRNIFYDLIETPDHGFMITLALSEHEEPTENGRGVVLCQFDPSLPLNTIISTLLALANGDIIAASERSAAFLNSAFPDSHVEEVSEETPA